MFEECIILLLSFGLFYSWFFFKQKQKQHNEHDEWLQGRRSHLKAIRHRFERECNNIVCEFIETKHSFPEFFSTQIKILKKRYVENLQTIYSEANHSLKISSLPDYIIKEYEAEIEHIANMYLDILSSFNN